jgi:hypothetical protein
MPTTTPSLAERLAEAQREAQALNEKLSHAEHEQALAVEEKRFGDAERAKAAADEVREPLLVAQAHVQALQAGIAELERHRVEEQRAQAERERREQAEAHFQTSRAAEAEAEEEMRRLVAEVSAAYGALVQTMQAAQQAEQRLSQARLDVHEWGKAAGHFVQDAPRPSRPNFATARFEHTPVLAHVLREPHLPF